MLLSRLVSSRLIWISKKRPLLFRYFTNWVKLGKYEKLIKTDKDLKTFEHFDISKKFRISGSFANFQNLEISKFRED